MKREGKPYKKSQKTGKATKTAKPAEPSTPKPSSNNFSDQEAASAIGEFAVESTKNIMELNRRIEVLEKVCNLILDSITKTARL